MIYFVQFRSQLQALLEQELMMRNFPNGPYNFVDGLTQNAANAIASDATLIVLGGSAELFLDQQTQNQLPVSTSRLIKLTRQVVKLGAKRQVPILGICFGHQLLARTHGAKVVANPSMVEIGVIQVRLHSNAVLSAAAGHRESVTELPHGARLLGESNVCLSQIVQFSTNVLGVQFHPEMTVKDVRQRVSQLGYHYTNNLDVAEMDACDEINRRFAAVLASAQLQQIYK